MEQQNSLHPEKKDELLTILANHHRRIVLNYFQNVSDDVASVQDLAEEIIEQDTGEEEQVTLQLHHLTLPQLADVGAIEYDQRSNTVRYQGHSTLEMMMGSIANL
ncbi:DUF7344 domain-containing protein [Natrinema soli]|uniref:DUF7344 domain-containing protein n=1 Tax=Natrinema soli TaxID=1930624 RepID=A0ABD5SX20_9EURY|nr:hypothetical protein [Natrinema soli]